MTPYLVGLLPMGPIRGGGGGLALSRIAKIGFLACVVGTTFRRRGGLPWGGVCREKTWDSRGYSHGIVPIRQPAAKPPPHPHKRRFSAFFVCCLIVKYGPVCGYICGLLLCFPACLPPLYCMFTGSLAV